MPQRRLYDLLKQRFWVSQRQAYKGFDELMVCLLPTGVAAVWLAGAKQVLIGRDQARAKSTSISSALTRPPTASS